VPCNRSTKPFSDGSRFGAYRSSAVSTIISWLRCASARGRCAVCFDLDSTVLTLYGHQARRSCSSRKRGRPSYHPLVCFEGQTRDFWHGELRPGDIHTATGAVWLLRACIAKAPATAHQIRVRVDPGFFDYKIVRAIEAHRGKFVIVARLAPPLKRLVTGLAYTEVGRDLALAECPYQPRGWPRPHRFVVVRKTLPEEDSRQTTLFTSGRYSYHAFVTNFRIRPIAVYRFYNAQAAVDLIIKELRADYPVAKIPTGQFAANEAYFHLLLFGYNLMNWWKRLCLPAAYHNDDLGDVASAFPLAPSGGGASQPGIDAEIPTGAPRLGCNQARLRSD